LVCHRHLASQLRPRIECKLSRHAFVHLSGAVGVGGRQHDLENRKEVPRFGGRYPTPLDAQLLPLRRSSWDLQPYGALGGRDFDTRAECRFPRRHRKVEVEVFSGRAIERIFLQSNLEVEVSGPSLANARSALAFESDMLPVSDPFRDGDIESSVANRDMAGRVDFGNPQ